MLLEYPFNALHWLKINQCKVVISNGVSKCFVCRSKAAWTAVSFAFFLQCLSVFLSYSIFENVTQMSIYSLLMITNVSIIECVFYSSLKLNLQSTSTVECSSRRVWSLNSEFAWSMAWSRGFLSFFRTHYVQPCLKHSSQWQSIWIVSKLQPFDKHNRCDKNRKLKHLSKYPSR